MATKTAKKKVRVGKKPTAKAAKKKATKKKTAKAKKKAKTKAKKPAKPKIEKQAETKPEGAIDFAIHEGHKPGDPITESDVVETPKLRVLEGNPIAMGKRYAYVAAINDDGEYVLTFAIEDEVGLFGIDRTTDAGAPFTTREESTAAADAYNERAGVTKLEASNLALAALGKQREAEAEKVDAITESPPYRLADGSSEPNEPSDESDEDGV